MPNHRVYLFHWNAEEAAELAGLMGGAGFSVTVAAKPDVAMGLIRKRQPDALVISLLRAPATGRDIALYLRKTAATRQVPLVFVEGDRARTEAVRRLLPDAVFRSGEALAGGVLQAMENPPADPVVPASVFAGYAGRPLAKKLGIREESTVILCGAPTGFERTLASLPRGVTLRRRARGANHLLIWFCREKAELDRRIGDLGRLAGPGGLWVAWPKKASGVKSDLTQAIVRRTGLDAGLVDYKVCAIDGTWSGLRFTRARKSE